jgi:hypothetical protein
MKTTPMGVLEKELSSVTRNLHPRFPLNQNNYYHIQTLVIVVYMDILL